jgi:hypothetical protein
VRLREGAGTFIGRWNVTLFGFAFLERPARAAAPK